MLDSQHADRLKDQQMPHEWARQNWPILTAIAAVAISWGSLTAKVSALENDVEKLATRIERFLERQE